MTERESPSTFELKRRFFQGARTMRVEIDMLEETYQSALATFESNAWTPQEGLQIALTMGLGTMATEQLCDPDSAASEGEDKRLTDRLSQLESLYAVMKFRVFHLMRDNQVLELQNSAFRNTVLGLESMVERLRRENAHLRNDLAPDVCGTQPEPPALADQT